MENEKNTKKTIGISSPSYIIIQNYCKENGLKISWLTEKVLLDYIKQQKINYESKNFTQNY